jgi:NTP pyrophosphatase (non-canonical NTP hydrolase)
MAEISVEKLTGYLRDFAHERDWEKFHTPKNLVLALVGEVGELSAEFQWLDEPGSRNLSSEQQRQVAGEIADVASYLFRLADVLDIDLAQALAEKIELNRVRYPVDKAKGSAAKYTTYE